jgi:hypothetical protein
MVENMKKVKSFKREFILWALPALAIIMGSCGTSHVAKRNHAFGGKWDDAALNYTPQPRHNDIVEGPGDSVAVVSDENGNAIKTNFNHIKTDIKHMTSREKLEGIKSEIPIFNKNSSFEDSLSIATQPQVQYFKNKNILVGSVFGFLGLITVIAFPIFGFLALCIGLLFGIAGVYDVHHPGEME